MNKNPKSTHIILVLIILSFAFYFLDYFFRISQSIIVNQLISQYKTNAVGVSAFSSAFYLGYAIFQFPCGYFLERFNLKPLYASCIIVCSLSYAAFLYAQSFWLGYMLRFIIGSASALSFTGILYIARGEFTSEIFNLIAGLAIAIGTLAGSCVQMICVWLMHYWHWHWQQALGVFSLLGLIIGLVFFVVPIHQSALLSQPLSWKKTLDQGKVFLKNPMLVVNAIIGSLFYLPTTLLASLWGIPFLTATKGFTKAQASFSIFLLFLGWAIAAPIMSYCANKVKNAWYMMSFFSLVACVVSAAFIYGPIHQHKVMNILILMIGLSSSAQAVVWKIFGDCCPPIINGVGIALTNMIIMLGAAILHLLVGYLLTLHWFNEHHHINFMLALSVIPFCFALVTCSALFLAYYKAQKS